MKILVAGAGGYIGIPVCAELTRRGHEVVALDRWFFEKQPTDCGLVTGDIRVWDNFTGIDAVIDLSGLSNDASAEIDPALTEAINVSGACQFANHAKKAGVRRYIYSSSASVYGHGEKFGLTEGDPTNPLTHYAKSKLAVERFLMSISGGGFAPVILRNATVFGVAPRMRLDLAVNIMTYRAVKEGKIYQMGGGEQWRPFIHVNDLARIFCEAIDASGVEGEIINVGHKNLQIAALARLVQDATRVKIDEIPDDPDKRSYHLSFSKMKTLFKRHEMKGVREGITEVRNATISGEVDGNDPRTKTLGWYKSILEWDNRIARFRQEGMLL